MSRDLEQVSGSQQVRDFTKRLLTDVEALRVGRLVVIKQVAALLDGGA